MKRFNIKSRKAQAAFEFMSTYGWAILILMAVLGALVYFMPNFRSATPEKCTFGPELACLGAQLSDNNLSVVLKNSVGKTVYNVSAVATLPKAVPCSVDNITIRSEQRLLIICNNTGDNSLDAEIDSRFKMIVTYKRSIDGYNQTVQGDIYAKME